MSLNSSKILLNVTLISVVEKPAVSLIIVHFSMIYLFSLKILSEYFQLSSFTLRLKQIFFVTYCALDALEIFLKSGFGKSQLFSKFYLLHSMGI